MEDPNESPGPIAIVCTLSEVLGSSQKYASLNVGDYLQASLSAILLSQNLKFSEVQMLTCDPIKDVINQFFTDKVYFQYKKVKFEYPKDLFFQNPIISKAKHSGSSEKFPNLFDETISKYKRKNVTSLFLIMIDHGDERYIGDLKFSHLLSTLSKKKFKNNFLFIDSCKSGSCADYAQACEALTNKGVGGGEAIAAAQIIFEIKQYINPDCAYDIVQTLQHVNIELFLKGASFDSNIFKVVSNFSRLKKQSFSSIEGLIGFNKRAKLPVTSSLKEACIKVDISKESVQSEWLKKLKQIGISTTSDFKFYKSFIRDLGLELKLLYTSGLYYLHQIYLKLVESGKDEKYLSRYFTKLQIIAKQYKPFETFKPRDAIKISKIIEPSADSIMEFFIPPELNLNVISSSNGHSSAYFYNKVLVNGKKIILGSYGTEFAALLACKSFSNFEELAKNIRHEIYISTKGSPKKKAQRPTYASIGTANQKTIAINKIVPKTPVFDMVCEKDDQLLNNFIRSSIYSGIKPTNSAYMLPITQVDYNPKTESSSDDDTKSPTMSTISSRSNSVTSIVENQMDRIDPKITSSLISSDTQKKNEPIEVITQSQEPPGTLTSISEDSRSDSRSDSGSDSGSDSRSDSGSDSGSESGSDSHVLKNPELPYKNAIDDDSSFVTDDDDEDDDDNESCYGDETPRRYKILGKSTIKMFFDCLNFQLIEHGYNEYHPDTHEFVIDEDKPAFEKFEVYEKKIDFAFKHYMYYSTIRKSLVLYLWENRKEENPEEIYDLFMDMWNKFSPINDFYVDHNEDCLDFR